MVKIDCKSLHKCSGWVCVMKKEKSLHDVMVDKTNELVALSFYIVLERAIMDSLPFSFDDKVEHGKEILQQLVGMKLEDDFDDD